MSLYTLLDAIFLSCQEKKLTLSGAESCTGGLVSSHLTSYAGASQYFLGSVVCYTKVAKHKILAVSDALLRQHGAVSHQVTVALVNGALQVFESDIAFAVTGFAGPKGIGDQYPVGTVFIGIGAKTLAPVVTRLQLSGERQAVIAQASHQVLFFLKEFIHHYKGSVI